MSLSNWWRRRRATRSVENEPGPEPPSEAASHAPSGDADLGVLGDVEVADPASVERAVAAFERLLRADRADAALERILELYRAERCPSALSCAAARALLARGELQVAARLLEHERTPEALLIRADIAAARGELAAAIDLAERALAWDLREPLARERLQRWQGAAAPSRAGADQPTLLSKDLPETSLRIVAEAGRGGVATVYRARDDVLGRDVALKVYHRPERDRDKLVREARMAVTLSMQGVVSIFDADPDQGWIAMEWVERGALGDLLRAGQASHVHPALGWFRDLTRVLARIHERGFVHADVKPANVLVKTPARVLVSDFGLALPFGATHLGASEGYVSPERQAGAAASPLDDVFSLGRVLERVLAGLGERDAIEPWVELGERLTGPGRPRDAGQVLPLVPTARGGRA